MWQGIMWQASCGIMMADSVMMPPDALPHDALPPCHLATFAPSHPGTVVTYPRVTWTTDLEGLMTSSEGAAAVPWRAWETRAQNLARGVRGEDIPQDPPWVKEKK